MLLVKDLQNQRWGVLCSRRSPSRTPEGDTVSFRYISFFSVDDQWKYAPDQQTQSDEHGNINNILDITNFAHYHFKIPTEYELV